MTTPRSYFRQTGIPELDATYIIMMQQNYNDLLAYIREFGRYPHTLTKQCTTDREMRLSKWLRICKRKGYVFQPIPRISDQIQQVQQTATQHPN